MSLGISMILARLRTCFIQEEVISLASKRHDVIIQAVRAISDPSNKINKINPTETKPNPNRLTLTVSREKIRKKIKTNHKKRSVDGN